MFNFNSTHLLFTAVLIFTFSTRMASQDLVVIEKDTILLEDIEYRRLDTITFFPFSGNLQVVNSSTCIVQLGAVEIARVNLKDGVVEHTLDMDELYRIISDTLSKQSTDSIHITDRSAYEGPVKPSHFPVWFNPVKKYLPENKFATLVHIGVTQYDKAGKGMKRMLPGVLLIDSALNIVNFLPFKEEGRLQFNKYIKTGGFFYDNQLFIKEIVERSTERYVYLRYQLGEDGFFQLVDTMYHWSAIYHLNHRGALQDHIIVRENSMEIPLQQQILMLSDWNDHGYKKELPVSENQYARAVESVTSNGGYLALIYENNSAANDDLSLYDNVQLTHFDKDFLSKSIIETFPSLDWHTNALSVHNNDCYVLAFHQKMKQFSIFHFKLSDTSKY